MHSQSSHRSPLKTITSVPQNIKFDLREYLENETASALGTTKLDLYAQQEKSQDPQQLSNAASTRYENPSSHITRKTKHQDSATRPHLTLLDPGEQTSPSTTQNGASCLCCQGSITKNKSVLSTILAPAAGRSISQSVPVLDGEGDRIVPTAATRTSPLFVFPDPYEPPADQDNSSIWKAVMARKKSKQSKSEANAKAAPTVAPSAGARGSSGFKRFLIKLLGKELDENSELTHEGPDSHFGPEQEHPPVTKYVEMYSGKEAAEFADIMQHFILPAKYSERELVDFLNRYIFTSNLGDEPRVPLLGKMDFDQKALKQKTEYTSRFQHYSISELRRGVADIRHLRLSPEERYEGRSTTNTPNLLPAETDLRGRCDMAFGIDERCLHFLSEGNVGGPVPCHDPVGGVCSIFGRAEVKKLDDSNSVEAARHQWASGAYLELLSRVKLADSRTDKSCRPVSRSTHDFRQYGYIICAAHVEIWVMRVTSFTSTQTDIPTRRDTFYGEEYLSFPAVRLASLHLFAPRAVERFCQWHAKIMNWGFNVYSRRYVDNIEDLHRSRRPVQDWTLSYEEAVGKDIPPLPDDEQEDTQGLNAETAAMSDSPDLRNGQVGVATGGVRTNTSLDPPMTMTKLKGSAQETGRRYPRKISNEESSSGTTSSESLSSEPDHDEKVGQKFSKRVSRGWGVMVGNVGNASAPEGEMSEVLDKTRKTKGRKRYPGVSTDQTKDLSESVLAVRFGPAEPKAKRKQSNSNGSDTQTSRVPSYMKPTVSNTIKAQRLKGNKDGMPGATGSASRASALEERTRDGRSRRCQAWLKERQCGNASLTDGMACWRKDHQASVEEPIGP